jgi:hypothetical protein
MRPIKNFSKIILLILAGCNFSKGGAMQRSGLTQRRAPLARPTPQEVPLLKGQPTTLISSCGFHSMLGTEAELRQAQAAFIDDRQERDATLGLTPTFGSRPIIVLFANNSSQPLGIEITGCSRG